MKCLYANGDSWTFGEELNDGAPDNFTFKYYNTWPFLLSQKLDIPICVNEALGGGNNDRIVRKTIAFILDWVKREQDPKNLLVVLGWTGPERFEVNFKSITGNTMFASFTPTGIFNYTPKNVDDETNKLLEQFRECYYRLEEEDAANERFFNQMLQMRLFCKGLGISYYDFLAFSKLHAKCLRKMEKLHIKDHWKNFNSDFTFRDLLMREGWGIQQHGHPSKNAHAKWADILAEKIQAL